MPTGVFPRLMLQLAAVALLCAAPSACAAWERAHSDDPAFSLEIPEGWRLQAVDGRGARLLPPDNTAPVEIVAWNALQPPATPEKAAVEHEGVLSRVVDYRRDGVESIETDEGAPALVVTGRVRSRGLTESSIFCAYSAGETHYVLGTFSSERALPQLRERVLDRMMRSFRAEDGATPVTGPPRPQPDPEPHPVPDFAPEVPPVTPDPEPAVEAQAGDAPRAITVGGRSEPVGPEVREPEVPWIEHLNPTGFSVSIPIDWEVEAADGVIAMRPAVEGERDSVLLIWPVSGPDPGAEAALRLALTRLPDLRVQRVASVEEIEGATLIDAAATGGRRLLATWAHDGTFGLLHAAAAPADAPESELVKLARMAASFRPGEWTVAHRPAVEMVGDLGLLRWTVPEGWQIRGGAREHEGELSIDVEALGPSEETLRIGWQQPLQPRFRALTPLLESLGWREGERYSVPEGGGGLLIYQRRSPERLVRDLLLPRHPRELRLTAIDAAPPDGQVAGLLTEADAVGQVVLVKGDSAIGPRERLYLAATARAAPPLSTTSWDGAALRADAPEGRLAAAVEVLVMMVRGAAVTERADHGQAQRLEALIERARHAVTAIPVELQPEGDTGLASVIDAGGSPGAAKWRIPDGGLQHWAARAGAGGATDSPGAPTGTRPER
ncbi:MAG: hypothetical protein ACOX9R_01735 [Armatimonadota bacterium]